MVAKKKKTRQAKPTTPEAIAPTTAVTLTLPPKLALDLVQAGIAWYGASFTPTAQELLRQVHEQTNIATISKEA